MDGVTEDPLRETRKQATERRITALEAHIEDLEERFRNHLHWLPTDGGRKWEQVSTTPRWPDA
jgi:hypothetical protein